MREGGGVLKDVGAWFWSKASGFGGGGGGKGGQFVHVSYKSFQGDKADGFGTSLLLGGGGAGGAAQYVRGNYTLF